MVEIVLAPAHGYIPLLVVGVAFVNVWAGMKVGAARKKYNVQYPQMYAEKSDKNAHAFNCVQRAHQNMVENLPTFYTLLFTSAPFRPEIAAAAGLARIVGFVAYVRGYSSGDPKKRHQGAFDRFVARDAKGMRFLFDPGLLGMLVSVGLSVEAGLRIAGFV